MSVHDKSRYFHQRDPQLYGSAEWASKKHLHERGYGQNGHHFLGYGLPEKQGDAHYPVTYGGGRHFLTVAPTRSGKSVSTGVPNLLSHTGSAFAMDIKGGELALITARYRAQVLGQKVYLDDPFDCVSSYLGAKPDQMNVLSKVDPHSDEAFENAMLIAEGLVIPPGSASVEPHWALEAQALLAGLILSVCVDKDKPLLAGDGSTIDDASLGKVRDILNLPSKAFYEYVAGRHDEHGNLITPGMLQSPNRLVRAAAGRITNKAERELSGVISTAQSNTHFLESPSIRKNLSRSTFSYDELADGNTTIYLILPAGRIRTFRGWLRSHIAAAIQAVTAAPVKPTIPTYFLLEEMATLERLDIIEQSYGLMAGYGLQLHGIIQDFSQLKELYKDRWQSFVANSSAIQSFGTRDLFTAEYLSKLCGSTSVEELSQYTAEKRASLFGSPHYLGAGDRIARRALINPEELMTLHPSVQLLVLAGANPSMTYKTAYFLDKQYRNRQGKPLFDIHPDYQNRPLPPAYDFTHPKLNLGALLNDYIKVG